MEDTQTFAHGPGFPTKSASSATRTVSHGAIYGGVRNPDTYFQETFDKMARRNACLDGKHEVEMAVDVSADFYERGNHDRKRDIFVCTHCRNLYVHRD